MSDISASAVASLRFRTGVSILVCKKALEDADGDEEKAIEILRKQGAVQAAKKADREQSEGIVFSAEANGKAALILVLCETDFVARDENFQSTGQQLAETLVQEGEDAMKTKAEELIPATVQKLGENISLGDVQLIEAPILGVYVHTNGKIGVAIGMEGGSVDLARDAAMHAAAMNPLFVSPEEVSSADVEAEKAIWSEQLAAAGKPTEIMEKIMMGKEKKFREESALLTQEFVKEPGKTVGEHLGDAQIINYVRIAVD